MKLAIRNMTKPYYIKEYETSVYFYTVKDFIEYAFYDKKSKTLYIKSELINQFKHIKRSIMKDYDVSHLSEYCDIVGGF